MKNLRVLALVVLATCALSCKKNTDSPSSNMEITNSEKIHLTSDEYISISSDDSTEISQAEALKILKEFDLDDAKTKISSSASPILVEKYYIGKADVSGGTNKSSTVSSAGSTSVPVYHFRIPGGKNQGSAYVTADPRHAGVLAYIPDDGKAEKPIGKQLMLELAEQTAIRYIQKVNRIRDSLKAPTLEKISKKLSLGPKSIKLDDIDKFLIIDGGKSSRTGISSSPVENPPGYVLGQIGPLTSVIWAQDWPYNNKLPLDPNWDFETMRYPAGCAVTAASIALSGIEPPMTVNGITVNWAYLKERNEIVAPSYFPGPLTPDPQDKLDMVGYLVKSIYDGTGTTTEDINGELQSSTSTNNLISYLRNYINIDNAANLNLDNVKASLDSYRLTIMGGVHDGNDPAKKGSHAWVIDGYRISQKPAREIIKRYNLYFHANMGWGGAQNGYYLVNSDASITFDTVLGSYNSNLWAANNARRK